MKHIQKQTPPETFNRYARTPGSSFKDLSSEDNREIKAALRVSLLEEQGYICCYCGQRVSSADSIIEHLKCRDRYPRLELDYMNLMCSCLGGQDKRSRNPQYPLHCDAIKGNVDIPLSPLIAESETLFKFDEDGHIYGMDDRAEEVIQKLNLDNSKLVAKRKNAIDAYRWLDDEFTDWEDEIANVNTRSADETLTEFCHVIKCYITEYRIFEQL